MTTLPAPPETLRVNGQALVGLVLGGQTPRVGVEPFMMEIVTGLEEALARSGRRVFLLVVPDVATELATYRRWVASTTVEAVVVVDLREGDARPALLAEIGLPAVLAGHYDGFPPMTRVVTDEAGAMEAAIEHLAALGHRVIGRVCGPAEFVHTQERSAAIDVVAGRLGVRVVATESDYSAAGGLQAARELLAAPSPPTALIFDNDVMALAALGDLTRRGTLVPGEVSLLSMNDSVLCDLSVPPLSALTIMNVHDHGVRLGEAVLEVLGGRPPREHAGTPSRVTERGTTGPAPRRRDAPQRTG